MVEVELDVYRENLSWELARIVASVAETPEELIHQRLDAPGTNSLAGIASHALGAAQEHVLGWVLNRALAEDVAGFDDHASAAALRERHDAVTAELGRAFAEISRSGLERLVPTPGRGQQSVRAVLAWAILHAAEHAGAAELTRDLLVARAGSRLAPGTE
jgi:hypothetical protein